MAEMLRKAHANKLITKNHLQNFDLQATLSDRWNYTQPQEAAFWQALGVPLTYQR